LGSNVPPDNAAQVRHHPLIAQHDDPAAIPRPAGFDCDFLGVKTRRSYYSGMLTDESALPLRYPPFDEEYFEWVDILEAVERADETFVMIELGAGYGRWCARAAAAARRKSNCRYHFVAVEAEPAHFRWIHEHFRDNGIDPGEHELIWAAVGAQPGFVPFWVGAADGWYGQSIAVNQAPPLPDATARRRLKARSALGRPPVIRSDEPSVVWTPCVTLADLLAPYPRVDLIDLDVQGAEYDVLASAIDVLDQRVRRLHIGTHSPQIEQQLRELLSAHGWQSVNDYPGQSTAQTPYGAIQFGDGVQTWVNPVVPGAAAPSKRKKRTSAAATARDMKLLRSLRLRVKELRQQNRALKRRNAELRERDRAREEQRRGLPRSKPWPLQLVDRWFARRGRS
jgi:FkbM family methyltransferase